MKLTKVHIALLTNVTEGKVKNEHITMYYSKEVTTRTVWERMRELNLRLPVDLFHAADKVKPRMFKSWSGEKITHVAFHSFEPEYEIFNEFRIETPHITLIKDATLDRTVDMFDSYDEFNWHEGLKVGECHVGWKENGEMVYRTETELIDWIANNA